MKIKIEIPEPLLKEMIAVFGEKKAKRIAKSVGYNYHLMVMAVSAEKFKLNNGISLGLILIIAIVILSTIIFLFNTY